MNLKLSGVPIVGAILICTYSTTSSAHHSVLHYDGKKEVTISGVVTKARFGYPHSIYRIEVTAEDGQRKNGSCPPKIRATPSDWASMKRSGT